MRRGCDRTFHGLCLAGAMAVAGLTTDAAQAQVAPERPAAGAADRPDRPAVRTERRTPHRDLGTERRTERRDARPARRDARRGATMSRQEAASWTTRRFEHDEVERFRAGFVAARNDRFNEPIVDPERGAVLNARRATAERRFAERLTRFDLDRDGALSAFEQRRFAAACRVQLRRFQSTLDANNDGHVCPDEFRAGTGIPFNRHQPERHASEDTDRDRLQEQLAFVSSFDLNDDGRLDDGERQELCSVTGHATRATDDH